MLSNDYKRNPFLMKGARAQSSCPISNGLGYLAWPSAAGQKACG